MHYNNIPEWAGKYVGMPFKSRGDMINNIDCWQLACKVYKQELGIDLDAYDRLYRGHRYEDNLIEEAEKSKHFYAVEFPQPFDFVIFKMDGKLQHVGISIIDDLVLHAHAQIESCIQSYNCRELKNSVQNFYRYS